MHVSIEIDSAFL